jgi:multidrug resistance efflux pump
VTVVKLEMKPVKRVVEQPGTIQAFEETALFAKLTGYAGALADDPDKKDRPPYDRQIDRGSRVKKDQVLAVLSIPELEEELKQKEALVEQAGAEVIQAEKALTAAETAIDTARAANKEAEAGVLTAVADVARWSAQLAQEDKLVEQKLLDPQSRAVTFKQLEASRAAKAQADARVESAAAAIRKATADRDRAVSDVSAVRARKKVAEANVGEVNARRGYLKIMAPFDGVVIRRGVNPGDLVSATEKAPLFIVALTDPVRVVVQVPEVDAGLVAVGQEARVTLQGAQGAVVETGKVARTSWALEPGSRTLWTEIDLPNPKGLVRPGMYASAKLTAELPAAWAVPAAAVGRVGDESVVYLVEGGKAVRVAVQLLKGDGQFTQLRRYKRTGATDWTDVTGAEQVATPAAALTDGQAVP